MRLYLVRHAWAAPAGEDWPDDFQRPLTAKGQRRFRRVAALLVQHGVRPELLVTSPLVRCQQTAALLAQALDRPPHVVSRQELQPGGSLGPILAWTAEQAADCREVAWVGHAPDVGEWTAALIGLSGGHIRFAKGAVAAVQFPALPEAGAGELRWLLTARSLGI